MALLHAIQSNGMAYYAISRTKRNSTVCDEMGKVAFLFDNKKEYIQQKIRGTQEGIGIWKNAKVKRILN